MLGNLPSSSNAAPQSTPRAVAFGEHLVDMIWSLDAELDEIISDAKATISTLSNEQDKSKDITENLTRIQRAKANTETDKEMVQAIVKRLLVRFIVLPCYG